MLVCMLVLAAGNLRGGDSGKWTWKVEKVGRGMTSAIAVDGLRNLHVTYFARDQKIYYGFRPGQSTKWSTMVLGGTAYTHNVFPRVATDASNDPHICYAIGTLRYVRWKNHKWVNEEVDPGSGTLSYHCSIAIGPGNEPHLGWYHEFLPGGKQFTNFRHAELKDGIWVARSVDAGISGKWNSMQIDPKGSVHASFSSWAHGELRYAESDGKDWRVTTVVKGTPAYSNSLVLTHDGAPGIAFFDENTLKYAYQSGTKWVVETVDSIAAGANGSAGAGLALDSRDVPHIVYGDFGSLKHAFKSGDKWLVEIIISGGVQQYMSPDIAIDPRDVLYVSFADPNDGTVKVAIGRAVAAAPSQTAAGKGESSPAR